MDDDINPLLEIAMAQEVVDCLLELDADEQNGIQIPLTDALELEEKLLQLDAAVDENELLEDDSKEFEVFRETIVRLPVVKSIAMTALRRPSAINSLLLTASKTNGAFERASVG